MAGRAATSTPSTSASASSSARARTSRAAAPSSPNSRSRFSTSEVSVMRSFFGKRLAPRAFARNESGTQLVELAIVLPVLLTLFAATAEFGRFFYTYQTLAKSTRSSARFLTTKAVEGPDADTIATNLAVYGNTDGTGEPLVSGLGPEH